MLDEECCAEPDQSASNDSYIYLPRNHLFRRWLFFSREKRLVVSNVRLGWRWTGIAGAYFMKT